MLNADRLLEDLKAGLAKKQWRLSLAESCTGGMLATVCTSIEGSSQWFDCGWVTYSNMAKQRMLGVEEGVLLAYGAVSLETAQAMADGALSRSGSGISLSITGIAGPGGGSPQKPVGTVCFAVADVQSGVISAQEQFSGDREQVREQAVLFALNMLIKRLKD